MSDSCDDVEQFGCTTLACGSTGVRVVLSKEAQKEFWDLDHRPRARLVANMDLWVDGRPMMEHQFNGSEGRTKGRVNRMLMAFKVKRIRCYGFQCSMNGRKTFVIIDIDSAKKTDKGKPRVLERAKQRVVAFETYYGDKYA